MQAFRNLSANATKLGFVFCEMFFVLITVKPFSEKASGLRHLQMFLNCGWLANAERNLRRRLGKIRSSEGLNFTFKTFFADLAVVHFDLQTFGVEMFPVVGKFPRQKHHDLAGKFGVWHVMCIRIPISCRSWICGGGMAHDVRSTSLVFLRGWRHG
jgi:hypothetical protein